MQEVQCPGTRVPRVSTPDITPRFIPARYCQPPDRFGMQGAKFPKQPEPTLATQRQREGAVVQHLWSLRVRQAMATFPGSAEVVAHTAAMSPSRLSRTLAGKLPVRVDEMAAVCRILKLDLSEAIALSQHRSQPSD